MDSVGVFLSRIRTCSVLRTARNPKEGDVDHENARRPGARGAPRSAPHVGRRLLGVAEEVCVGPTRRRFCARSPTPRELVAAATRRANDRRRLRVRNRAVLPTA